MAIIGRQEHFWSEDVAERIWRSAVPESIRIFVFTEFEDFKDYYESLLPHAAAYSVHAILAQQVPTSLRAAIQDFALIDANGDRLLATYEGHGEDARISFCRNQKLYAEFERRFRSLLEISPKFTRDSVGMAALRAQTPVVVSAESGKRLLLDEKA